MNNPFNCGTGKRSGSVKKLITWVTLFTFLAQPICVAAAQTVADPNASVNKRPTVEKTQNGLPLIQIAAPSAAGVSHNQYLQFHVDQQGLILNNSKAISQTQLGGYIIGNPNLVNNPARIILNEVTGTSASQLRGYTEVAGQRAEVILANPNGITGNGFGFINTSRAVLTTGVPVIGGSGSLDAFRVTRGTVSIEGQGMDATNIDRVDIISRATAVNAGIWAKELNLTTGSNQVSYDTLNTEKIDGDSNTPTVSLDVGALGGMYADKIKLIGTEKGVGVNSQGTITASSGDLILTQEGKIIVGGAVSAAGNIQAHTSDHLTNAGRLYAQGNIDIVVSGTVENSGVIAAAQNAQIEARTVKSTGSIGAGIQSDGTIGVSGSLTLTAQEGITAHGQNLAADSLKIQATTLTLSGANTYAGNTATLIATAGDIDNTGGSLAGKDLHITAQGRVKNDTSLSKISAEKLSITASDLSNKGGEITQSGQTAATLTVSNRLDNTGGTISANGIDLNINAKTIINKHGAIQHAGTGALTINTAADLATDSGTIHGNGDILIHTQDLNNTGGSITAQKQLTIDSQTVSNTQGSLTSGTATSIAASNAVSNQQGVMEATGGLRLTAGSLDNREGRVTSLDNSGVLLATQNEIANQSGLIGGNGTVTIKAASIANSQGRVSAKDGLDLTVAQTVDNANGIIAGGKNLTLSSGMIHNQQGTIQAVSDLTIQASSGLVNGGTMAAGQDLTVNAGAMTSDSLQAGRDISLTLQGDFTNNANGLVQANRNLVINAGGAMSNQGAITALNGISVSGSSINNSNGASVKAGTEASISANTITNQGTVYSNMVALNTSGAMTNTGILAAGDQLTLTGKTISSTGSLISGLESDGSVGTSGDLLLTASQAVVAKGKNIAGGNLSIQGTAVDLSGSTTYAGNSATITATAGDIINSGGQLTVTNKLNLSAQGAIKNSKDAASQSGSIQAGTLAVAADSIINQGSSLRQTGTAASTISAANGIDNTGGQIASNGVDLNLSANSLNNSQGKIEHAGIGTLTIQTATDVNNASGSIISNGTATIGAARIDNSQGTLFAQNQLSLNAISMSNDQGLLVSKDSIQLQATGQITNQEGAIEASKGLTIQAQTLDNQNGRMTSLDASGLTISTSQELANQSGLIGSNGAVAVNAGTINNTAGQIIAQEGLAVTSASDITNRQGILSAGQDLILTQTNGRLDNAQGTFQAGNDLKLNASSVILQGGSFLANRDLAIDGQSLGSDNVQAGRDISLAVQGGYTNNTNGLLQANRNVTISAGGSITNQGTLIALNEISASGNSIDNGSGAAIKAGTEISVSANTIGNQGTVYSNTVTLHANGVMTNSGILAAGDQLSLTGKTIGSTGTLVSGLESDGSIGTSGNLLVTATETVAVTGQNIAGGNLSIQGTSVDLTGASTYAGGSAALTASAGDVTTTNGILEAKNDLVIQAQDALTNDRTTATGGAIKADKLLISVNRLSNRGGTIAQVGQTATTLTMDTIDNTAGTIATNGTDLTINTTSLNNSQGQIQHAGTGTLTLHTIAGATNAGGVTISNGAITLDTGTLNNVQGLISAKKQLTVTTGSIDNTSGNVVSNEGLRLTTGTTITNLGGRIEAGKGLELTAQNLVNQNGRLISLDASGMTLGVSQDINNLSGLIGSNGTVAISARSLRNTSGQVLALQNLTLTTQLGTNNNQGILSAGQNLSVNQTGVDLNNTAGKIEAGNSLSLQAAAIQNEQGRLASQDISLTFSSLAGAGTVDAGRDLSLTVNGGFTNQTGNVWKANRDLTLTATGAVANSGLFEAGQNLTISGSSIVNDAGATLAANNALNANATSAVTNSGSLFGRDVTVKSNSLTNTNATAAIAATNSVNLFAPSSVENKDGATIYSMGSITIAGSDQKDGAGNYTTRTGSLLNQSANIEADGDIAIYADTIVNKKREFAYEQKVTTNTSFPYEIHVGSDYDSDSYHSAEPYLIGNNILLIGESSSVTTVSKDSPIGKIIAGRNMKLRSNSIANNMSWLMAGNSLDTIGTVENNAIEQLNTTYTRHLAQVQYYNALVGNEEKTGMYYLTGYIVQSLYDESATTQLPVSTSAIFGGGKQVTIQGTSVNNVTVTPGSIINSPTTINSSGMNTSASTVQSGSGTAISTSINTSVATGTLPSTTGNGVTTSNSPSNATPVQSGSGAAPTTSVNTGVSTNPLTLNGAQSVSSSANTSSVAPVQTNNGGNITLPQNGMFAVRPEPTAKYLVETNSRFTSYNNFISSDYLLDKLQYDPAATAKRLGDGFYEQKLVREQITELTGRVYLSGYDNSEEQYKALLTSGATYAQAFNLKVGVALSADQMAQLTTDMVWMVEKEVAGQKVLVPVVYFASGSNINLKTDGAVIAADTVNINVTGDVVNSGSIKALESVSIGAVNVSNVGGSISSNGLTSITASQSISSLTGSMSGQNLLLNAGQDISLLGTALNVGGDLGLTAGRDIQIGSVAQYTSVASAGSVSNQTSNILSSINAGGNISFTAQQNLSFQAVEITAGRDISLLAGGSLAITAAQNSTTVNTYSNSNNYSNQDNVVNKVSSLVAGGALSLLSGGNMTLTGLQASSGSTINILTGGDLLLNSVTDSSYSDVKSGSSKNNNHIMTNDETVVVTNLISSGDIAIKAVGSMTVAASSFVSDTGAISLIANKGITLEAVTETHESLVESHKTKSGFLSKKVTDKSDYSLVNEVVGNTISGEAVTIQSGADLTIKASNLVATNDLSLTAANNLAITSAAETGAEDHYQKTKKSGLFGGGGFGFTIGSKSEKSTENIQTLGEVGSTIGSLNGNVTLQAGNQVTSTGTTIVSAKDLDITGKAVTIDNTINTYDSQSKYEVKQSGLSVSLGGGAVGHALSAVGNAERAKAVEDDRLKALYTYKAVNDVNEVVKAKGDLTKGVAVSVSLGSSKQTSEQTVHTETVNTSNINAGGAVRVIATAGDVTLSGVKLNAGDVAIQAAKDINLRAAQNKQQIDSKTKSSSWSVGGSIGTGYFASASSGSSKEHENTVANVGSVINASGIVTLDAKNDANIIGSQVKGDKVIADIDGNLNIASLQDLSDYTAKNKNSGIELSSGIKTGTTGSIGSGKTNSTYASVTEQAGIFAGTGGFDLAVGKNTDLKGAVIASEATPDKNKLSTVTLTFSDVNNKAEYKASGFGINYSSKEGEKGSGIAQGITPNLTPTVKGDADSVTKSAISVGTIIVGGVKVDPNISRDPQTAVNALGKIFDKKTVQEQQELSSMFGQMAFEAVGEIARKQQLQAGAKNYEAAMLEKVDPNNPKIAILRQDAKDILAEWGQGGTSKIALHALVGGIMSDLSGNSFGVGATSAGINEALQKGLGAWEEKNPALNQWASLVIGGAVGGLVDGSVTNAGNVALSGTKYNADVPKLLLGAAGAVIPDSWIDAVFNPGLKKVFQQVDISKLQPNQYMSFAVDVGGGVTVRAGYIIDGTGNVFEVTGVGGGVSVLPVSVGGTIGIVLKQEGYGYEPKDMNNEMSGYSVGFSFQGGVQGGLSVSIPSGTWYGEVGVVANAGLGGAVTKTNYLFNIYDR